MCSVADLLLSNKPLLNKLTSVITMVRDTLYSERGNDKWEHNHKIMSLRLFLVCPNPFMQENVASGRQCVAVSLELVGSLVESYQHGHSDATCSLVCNRVTMNLYAWLQEASLQSALLY